MPEYWKDGTARCPGEIYEYVSGYSCSVEGPDGRTVQVGFDLDRRLTEISHFAPPVPPEKYSKLDGPYVEVHPDGSKRSETLYRQGTPVGRVTAWHPGGAKSWEGQYVDGRLHGTFHAWDATGKEVGTFTMRNGTGRMMEWHPNGVKASEIDFVDGKKHGASTQWYPNGKKRSEQRFHHDEPAGRSTTWTETGTKLVEGQYADGDEVGVWKYHDEKGRLLRVDTFEDGSLVESVTYQDGKRLGRQPSPGMCATKQGLAAAYAKQIGAPLDDGVCVKRPVHFPGVVVFADFAHDRGCMTSAAFADCRLESKLDGTQILARAGWKDARPDARESIARNYVSEIALVWEHFEELSLTRDADGGITITTTITEPPGMREDTPRATSQATFHFSRAGVVTRKTSD
jgi:antitoxin component YwqK of YwqJK toxin-antitoxin module